jgi:hypothetical protein
MSESYTMSKPCVRCGSTDGALTEAGPHWKLTCLDCGAYQRFISKAELGLSVRSLSDRPDIKPKKRARILDRDNGRCVICGRDDELHIGHILSVDEGRALGWADEQINDDENLAALCALCNAGYGSLSINPRLAAALIQARIQRGEQTA